MTVAEYNHAVSEYADKVYRFILKNIREENAAQDIVQDTYEKLWVKHESVNYSKVKSYLFTAAYHTMIDYTRRKKHQVEIDQLIQMEVQENNNDFDLKAKLDRALGQIPEIQRSVILLRDYEGYNYECDI